MKRRSNFLRVLGRALTYALAILIALWILGPIYLIGVSAFGERLSAYAYPRPFWPAPFTFETMAFFLKSGGVIKSVQSSVIVALITLVLSTLIGAPAGYAIARFLFRGRDAFRLVVVSTRSFPIVILSIPLAVTFIEWGMYDSVYSLALMHTALALPFTILITSSVFASVPRDLEEAAQTLGCNQIEAFLRISLPLALPGLAAATLFTFVLSWNEVFAAVILTVRNRTLPALVLTVLSESQLPYRFAGGFFMMVPSLIFMLFIRRYLLNLWGRVTK
ncbi:MAG: sugar ABC transporter permease [Chloroflexi bacterium RIFOXYD12_FULL_57_15]|nr:MAG: sugar ABC transporter permease [Chloroflexi bacterium RIFOXYD12_FULL_57_15]